MRGECICGGVAFKIDGALPKASNATVQYAVNKVVVLLIQVSSLRKRTSAG